MIKLAKSILSLVLVSALLFSAVFIGISVEADPSDSSANFVPTNILEGKTVKLYQLGQLSPNLTDNTSYNTSLPDTYSGLTLTECGTASSHAKVYAEDIFNVTTNDYAECGGSATSATKLPEEKGELLKLLATKGNTRGIRIQYATSSNARKYRAGLLYDLGEATSVNNFKLDLTQVLNSSYAIYNFSVYAGDSVSNAIFNNKIGNGSGTGAGGKLSVTLNCQQNVRYIFIMFDHVSGNNTTNIKGSYYRPLLTNIELYNPSEDGSGVTEDTNIIEGSTAQIFRTTLSNALTNKGTYSVSAYTDIAPTTSDFISYAEDISDKNENSNVIEYLSYNDLEEQQDDLLKLLTTKNNQRGVSIQDSSTGSANALSYRTGLVYDLGAYYKLDDIVLEQKSTFAIHNFSVYAGQRFDAAIFQNKIGEGGGTSSELSVTLSNADEVRYVLIMFDHVSAASTTTVYKYGYKPTLTQIKLHGEKVADLPVSIIEDKVAKIYRTDLSAPLENLTDYSPLTYDNISGCLPSGDFITWGEDVENKDNNDDTTHLSYTTLGYQQEDLLKLLTTKNNTYSVRIDHGSGGDKPLSHRVGLVYDLGAYYKVNKLTMLQKTGFFIYNFTVYAGNKLDATIFQNKIGEGGGTDKELTATFTSDESARYVLIMFDHVSNNTGKINIHTYRPTLTNIELYGEKTAEIVLPQSIIEGKVAKIYRTDLSAPLTSLADFSPLTYTNLSGCLPNTDFVAWAEDVDDIDNNANTPFLSYDKLGYEQEELLKCLTTKNNTHQVRIDHTSGGPTIPLSYRSGLVYDLGAFYKLDGIALEQKTGLVIYNFSVYAGEKLDATIFQNKIGEGGGTSSDLSVEFESENLARYVLIMFDHVSDSSGKINAYTYKPTLTKVEIYGEKAADLVLPQSIIEGKAAKVYRTDFDTPLISLADFSPLTYTNLSGCAPSTDFVSYSTDIDDVDNDGNTTEFLAYTDIGNVKGLGVPQEDLLKLLTTKDNKREVRIEHTSGGLTPLSHRAGLVYDLGALYKLDGMALEQSLSYVIYNFSVYAGEKLDATIFNNKIGEGGGSDTNLSLEFETDKTARYVLIMFDHVSDGSKKINAYTYKPTLTNVEIYGEKKGDITVKSSIVEGGSAKIYRTDLSEPLTSLADFSPLTYTNLSGCAPSSDFVTHSTDINDKNGNGNKTELLAYTDIGSIKGLGESQEDLLKLLTTKDNKREVKIEHTSGGDKPLYHRAGLVYDLGALYKLDGIALVQKSNFMIYNFSVYAGNKLDATIFQNKIGEGGGTGSDLSATFENGESARYVLIMFDHVSDSSGKINQYTYKPTLTQVEIYGKKTGDLVLAKTIIEGKSAKIYRTDLSEPLTSLADFSPLTYTNLSGCAPSSDFVTHSTDINDKNGNGNKTELLAYTDIGSIKGLGESQEDLLKLLTTKDNKREVKIEHTSGGDKPLYHRAGLVYDLGALYKLDGIALVQKSNFMIYNFSVYAGNKLDATIFQNKIGEGGGTGSDLSATFENGESARYVLIMFDHVSDSLGKINQYTYKPTLTQVEIYGKKTGDLVVPESIIKGKTAKIYRTKLSAPLESLTEYNPLSYTTLSESAPKGDFISWSTDINDKDEDGNKTELLSYIALEESQEDLLKLLTKEGNAREIKIEHSSGGDSPLKYRAGLVYDLGDLYKLDGIDLEQKSSFVIHNFSVYAGNKLDATIFNNKIGEGGGAGSDLSATLETKESARYVLIMFDHVSEASNKLINQYTYKPTLTQVKLYGQKTSNWVEPTNLLNGNTTASVVRSNLSTPLSQEATFAALTYDNIAACAKSGDFITYSTDINDKNENGNTSEFLSYSDTIVGEKVVKGLGETPSELLKLLTTTGNKRPVKLEHSSGGDASLSGRVGIVYDLGAYYKLNNLVLTQMLSTNIAIYNFSVYGGDKLDATIFKSKLGEGGSDADDILTVNLNSEKSVRYVLIMFDHVSQTGKNIINKYAYKPTLTQVELYGEKTSDIVVPNNILNGNKTGNLYNIMLDKPYVTGEEWYKQDYNNLNICGITRDFVITERDIEDADEDGKTDDFVQISKLGKTNTQVLEKIATTGNKDVYVIEHTSGGETPNHYRVAIGYDLGALYDLDSLVFTQNTDSGRVIYNTSLYAGSVMDETIFDNCIGTGGDPAADGTTEIITKNAKSVRYVLLVIDHVTDAKRLINQYTFYPRLVNIAAYGNKVGEIPPEVKRESILNNNKTGALYSIVLENPYTHEGEVKIDYNTLKYTNLTLAKKADQYPFLTYRYEDKWDVNDESESLALLTTEGNDKKIKIQHGRGGDVPLKFRVGILYDLGNWYDVESVHLSLDNSGTQVRNFSVYAGNSIDATIFENRVGTGGSKNASATKLKSNLKDATAVRYLLIVFDHVSNLEVANKYAYTPYLTQVEAFGEINPNPPKVTGSSYGTNILLNNTSGRVYQVSGEVPHNIDYTPDYDTLVYKNLYDNNVKYRRYGTDFEKKDENKPEYYEDPSLKIITDGSSDKSILIDTGTDRSNGFIESKRIAIFYDLGDWYDLSTVVLKQDLSKGSAIRNYSVYAGAFGDSRLLENRVGIGGGTYESLVSNLSNAKSVRYIVVVLDHVSSTANNLSNYYMYRPFITELECYGTVNKNPTIPVDTKNNILRSADIKANMVFVDHEFSWTDSFEKGSFNYTSDKYAIQSELAPDVLEAWTDGKGSPSAYWSSGISSKNNITKRKGVLFDLGGFYNLNGIEIDISAVINDGRYIYDYTVYAGAVSNGSILSNLVAHGGSNEDILTSEITYDKSVRYVLIMFNKLGTDPGNLNDKGEQSLASKVNRTGALPGCTWADSGVHIGEISIYGHKGVDNTQTLNYTDPDSGVEVEVITYNNDVKIEKIAVSRIPVTDLQKNTLKLDAMYPVGDGYQVEFYDKDGNLVTDMTGRQFKVSFPMIYGDETAYGIYEDLSLNKMDLTLDMDNNMLVYTSTPELSVFKFIIASYTDLESVTSNNQDVGTDSDVKEDVDVALVSVISAAALIVTGSGSGLLIFLMRRRKRII